MKYQLNMSNSCLIYDNGKQWCACLNRKYFFETVHVHNFMNIGLLKLNMDFSERICYAMQ